jgi:hypothetical protein
VDRSGSENVSRLAQSNALFWVHPTPDSMGLADLEGASQALLDHGARGTNGFGRSFLLSLRRTASKIG